MKKLIAPLVLTFTLLTSSVAAWAQLNPAPVSKSDLLDQWNNDSANRRLLIQAAQQKITRLINKTPGYQKFRADIRAHSLGGVQVLATLKDGSRILDYSPRPGTSARGDLLLWGHVPTAAGGSSHYDVLLDAADLRLGPTTHFGAASVSPDEKTVAIGVALQGEISIFHELVYDLADGKSLTGVSQSYVLPQHNWSADGATLATYWFETGTDMDTLYVDTRDVHDLAAKSTSPKIARPLDPKILAQMRADITMGPDYAGPHSPISSTEWARSEDGMMVSYRIIRLPGTRPDGQRPVFIESYGGFGKANNPYVLDEQIRINAYSSMDFIQRGGLYVLPSLRGGDEGGDPWHQAAMGADKKMKTFQDLIAVARDLTKKGWTTPGKIISFGGSNGGLTVAASALLAPDAFGLVIPAAGVLDPAKILTLDAYNGPGWTDEYGDPTTQSELISKYSPVELAGQQGNLHFLIMTGDRDDRVNMAHSVKFFAALQKWGAHPENVSLYVAPGAGHWSIASNSYNEEAGFTGQAILWAEVYSYLGWSL